MIQNVDPITAHCAAEFQIGVCVGMRKCVQIRRAVSVLLADAQGGVQGTEDLDTKLDMSETKPTGRKLSLLTYETCHGSKQRCRQTSTPK